jgi:hypothetical protein
MCPKDMQETHQTYLICTPQHIIWHFPHVYKILFS